MVDVGCDGCSLPKWRGMRWRVSILVVVDVGCDDHAAECSGYDPGVSILVVVDVGCDEY